MYNNYFSFLWFFVIFKVTQRNNNLVEVTVVLIA